MPITGTSPTIVVPAAGGGSVAHFASICDLSDADQLVAAGASAYASISTVTTDTDGFYTGVGNVAFTIPASLGHGIYRVSVRGSVHAGNAPAPNAGNQSVYINVGPVTVDPDARSYYQWDDPADDKIMVADFELYVGDQVAFEVVNNTNGQLVIDHGGGQTYWRATIWLVGLIYPSL